MPLIIIFAVKKWAPGNRNGAMLNKTMGIRNALRNEVTEMRQLALHCSIIGYSSQIDEKFF